MDATKKSGVTTTVEEVKQKLDHVKGIIGDPSRQEMLSDLSEALQAVINKVPFEVLVRKPRSVVELCSMANSTQQLFNQLASEVPFWMLLDQLEEFAYLQPDNIAKVQPFVEELWAGEVASEPFAPPKGFRYLPVGEACSAYVKMFGKMQVGPILTHAGSGNVRKDSEGVAVWPKLSTLARIFGVKGNPLETTDEGRGAYARIIELLVPIVGKVFVDAGLGGFTNWREGELSSKHIILTPAGIKTWALLEKQSTDDFCYALAGATTGITYGGYSVRRSRVKMALARDQFGQDVIMTGCTLATQPQRMAKYEYLGMDCPANAYSPVAVGGFDVSLGWCFVDGELHFDGDWAGFAFQDFGSAVGFFS